MNALELLKTDHEKVSGILERLDQTTERALKTREDQYARLKEELETHSYIEETIFYPALAEDNRTHALTLEAYEEHRVIKSLLQDMDSMPVDTEEWTAKFKVLKTSVEQHVQEEEKEIFPQARQVLTKARLEELGAELEEAKQTESEDRLAEPAVRANIETRESRPGAGSERTRRAQKGASRGQGPSVSISLACPTIGLLRRICG
jgi:iron-sulfur cluster repair protein YtfE (RIC family)